MSQEPPPCHCPIYDRTCKRNGTGMTLREWEICSGKCPPERPCPDTLSEDFRRSYDGLPQLDRTAGRRALPCVHRGDAAGEVLCPSCQGRVALKVFSCAKHGECTLAKAAPGKPCCATCPDYESAQYRQQAGQIRNLLYHVYPIAGNGVWQWNVGQMLRRIELFNGRRVVKIAVDGRTDPARDVRDLFSGRVHEFIETVNRPHEAEMNGFEDLFGRVETGDPRQVTLYAHAKGVGRAAMPHIKTWVEILYETYLDYWPLVEQTLKDHPTAGSFKRIGQPTGWPASANWHYSGSWFWFRNRDLFKDPNWCEGDRRNIGIELYPSQHFTREESGLLFFEWPVQPLGLYEDYFVRDTVLPALDEWRKEHAAHRRTTW